MAKRHHIDPCACTEASTTRIGFRHIGDRTGSL